MTRQDIERALARGEKLSNITRHMLGLFAGLPGARNFRRRLALEAVRPGAGIEVLKGAVSEVVPSPSILALPLTRTWFCGLSNVRGNLYSVVDLRAFLGGPPTEIGPDCRLSDGGEPSGTAGQPILRAIQGQSLDHVAVGVIRYFSGTLLGT